MTDEQRQASADGEEVIVMEDDNMFGREFDGLDELIILGLSGAASRSGQDAELAGALSGADRRALAALGEPREFVRRVLARANDEALRSTITGEVERETVGEADRAGVGESDHDPQEFQDLMAAYESWQSRKQVGWSCEFRMLEELGRGGQGIVYLIECLDKFLDKMALKVFSPELYGSRRVYERKMDRSAEVARIVKKIRHDNLLQVERFKEHDGCFVMVMELIAGFDLEYMLLPRVVSDLKEWLTRNDAEAWRKLSRVVYGPRGATRWGLQPGVAVKIIEACLRGLDALHDQEIVHCDIKPSNIMINCHGSVKLIDIGSAFQMSSSAEKPAYTPRYAPPEVLEGGDWTTKSDLASLGYVLVELLSGQPDALVETSAGEAKLLHVPLDSESVDALDQPTRAKLTDAKWSLPSRLAKLIPEKAQRSERLITLCNRLIDPNPAKRFFSAADAISGPHGTHEFLSELKTANLAVYWPLDLEYWVTRVEAAKAKTSQSMI